MKAYIEADTHIITNQTEISSTTDIRYIYLTIVFALTFSDLVMNSNVDIKTWYVSGALSSPLCMHNILDRYNCNVAAFGKLKLNLHNSKCLNTLHSQY